ncbi:MAG TPA: flagellar motor protein [Firmicutes bacterium]|jgi:chemotaxis protein MotA|nr:flagellar motor protein [Bacillota bacterium]
MDLATIVGLLLAVGAIITSCIIEGDGQVSALLGLMNGSAALIVFGGTIGATMVCMRLKDFMNIGKFVGKAMKEDTMDITELIGEMVRYAEMARKEGLLTLEEMIANVKNDFLRKGIQLIVDGTDPTLVREILEIETGYMEERHKTAANLFQLAGGFSPTMGIVGTVMGLINVLAHMSDAASLGPAISTAFTATFYGIFAANVFWLPIGNKLKASSKEESAARQIIIEGILSIQAGEHPRVIGEKLTSFLPPSKRMGQAKANEALGARG